MRIINGRPRVCAPAPKINGPSADRRNQLYGRYEARFRADATDGYKLAWFLWPKSDVWPRDGEIELPRRRSCRKHRRLHAPPERNVRW
jgi:hypothetical protein